MHQNISPKVLYALYNFGKEMTSEELIKETGLTRHQIDGALSFLRHQCRVVKVRIEVTGTYRNWRTAYYYLNQSNKNHVLHLLKLWGYEV